MDTFSSALVTNDKDILKRVDDARYKLREMMQRWNDRLILQNLSVLEKYLEGRLTILCDLQERGLRYCAQFRALTDLGECRLLGLHQNEASLPSRDNIQADNRSNWNQETVFVVDVQGVEGIKKIIPSAVRLYFLNDEIIDARAARLYFSLFQGSYQTVFLSGERKFQKTGWFTSAKHNDGSVDGVIESCMQIVKGIPDNKGNLGRKIAQKFQFKSAHSISISLDAHSIAVALKECGDDSVKLLDVLIGPFNL